MYEFEFYKTVKGICLRKNKLFVNNFFCFIFSARSQLPLRATRLLNRRFQNTNNINNNNNNINNTSPLNGSESPRSLDSMQSRSSARASLREHLKQRQQLNLQSQLEHSSTEDLLVDKSLRNSMLQDVTCFKKQLVQLRRILQEVSASFV